MSSRLSPIMLGDPENYGFDTNILLFSIIFSCHPFSSLKQYTVKTSKNSVFYQIVSESNTEFS